MDRLRRIRVVGNRQAASDDVGLALLEGSVQQKCTVGQMNPILLRREVLHLCRQLQNIHDVADFAGNVVDGTALQFFKYLTPERKLVRDSAVGREKSSVAQMILCDCKNSSLDSASLMFFPSNQTGLSVLLVVRISRSHHLASGSHTPVEKQLSRPSNNLALITNALTPEKMEEYRLGAFLSRILPVLAQLADSLKAYKIGIEPFVKMLDQDDSHRTPDGLETLFGQFYPPEVSFSEPDKWMSMTNTTIQYLTVVRPGEEIAKLVKRIHYVSFVEMFRSDLFEACV